MRVSILEQEPSCDKVRKSESRNRFSDNFWATFTDTGWNLRNRSKRDTHQGMMVLGEKSATLRACKVSDRIPGVGRHYSTGYY